MDQEQRGFLAGVLADIGKGGLLALVAGAVVGEVDSPVVGLAGSAGAILLLYVAVRLKRKRV